MLGALGVLWLTASGAEDIQKSLLSCSAEKNSIKRLECFDRLASKEQKEADIAAAQKVGGHAAPTNWHVAIKKSPVDDSTTVILSTESKDFIPGRHKNRPSRPTLIVRCLENTTAAYINFDGHHMADIQNYGRVTFRVDKQKAFTRSMDGSTDNRSLGLWGGGSAIPLIKKLIGGESLLIQATPYSESSMTFTMDISGLDEAIKPLRKACNW